VSVLARPPHCLVLSLCAGLAVANALRLPSLATVGCAAGLALAAVALDERGRLVVVVGALLLAGWWWGSLRLDGLDRSVLLPEVGRAERSLLVTTAPAKHAAFQLRQSAQMLRFGRLQARENVLLELPPGRAPPQGALLEVLGVLKRPRGASHGFDERTWLRRHGVHVVLKGDRWRRVGRRGGFAGAVDRLRGRIEESIAAGQRGERRALLLSVVLGEDQGLSPNLQQRFRASGLYHLLAVSGENIALVAGAALLLVWLAGLPRWLGHVAALAAIAAYVLAVGPQPSVLRAGVTGALCSLAWLAARQTDRWYFLLLGAAGLLAWNPYLIFDAGFQLSFGAVIAIFTLVPPLLRFLEGYPLPAWMRGVVAVSAACGVATAPIMWLQFHALSLVTVPANVVAGPAMVPLLGLALASVAIAPLAPGAAAACAWLNGWCVAYLALCARVMGGLPGAQIRSTRAAAVLAAGGLLAAAYAWRRWQPRSSSPST
jgi:competence protein ComEC